MAETRRDVVAGEVRNALLRRLPPAALPRVLARLEPVELVFRTILLVPETAIDFVYFVESGTVSMISVLEDGGQIEVGLVGWEGFVGLPVLLGAPSSPQEALVQVAGTALRLPAAELAPMLAGTPELMALMLRYVDAFHVQVAQTATCNGSHQLEQRLARWILMTQDRAGGDRFSMTQEFLSHMLGVHRPGVTLGVGALQRAGLVRHQRGEMIVLDRAGLEAASCECYGHVRRRMAWLTGADLA